MEVYWDLINQGLAILLAALAGLLIAYAVKYLRARLTAEQLGLARFIVAQAVTAAEQYGGSNEEKKRQALALAAEWLEERGIYLNLNDLDAAIEAAVYEELNKFKELRGLQPGAAAVRPEAAE